MRGAGGGEALEYKRIGIDRSVGVPLERRFSLRAVEKDMRDCPVVSKERPEVVCFLRIDLDSCIQAPLPHARVQHIP